MPTDKKWLWLTIYEGGTIFTLANQTKPASDGCKRLLHRCADSPLTTSHLADNGNRLLREIFPQAFQANSMAFFFRIITPPNSCLAPTANLHHDSPPIHLHTSGLTSIVKLWFFSTWPNSNGENSKGNHADRAYDYLVLQKPGRKSKNSLPPINCASPYPYYRLPGPICLTRPFLHGQSIMKRCCETATQMGNRVNFVTGLAAGAALSTEGN